MKEGEKQFVLDWIQKARATVGKLEETPVSLNIEQASPVIEEIRNETEEPLKKDEQYTATTEKSPVEEKVEELNLEIGISSEQNDKFQEQVGDKKATIAEEHAVIKKWPPEEVFETPIEEKKETETVGPTEKKEELDKIQVIVQPEEIRELLAKGMAEGISQDATKKIENVVILPFRSGSRSFSFAYMLVDKNDKTSISGLVRVPTGKKENFEVEIKPDGLTNIDKNGLKNFLKNTTSSLGELLFKDKTEMANKNAENVLEVIKRVVKEKYGNTIPMIEE